MALSKYIGTLTSPTSTGNQAITGVGFIPACVIFYSCNDTAAGGSSTARFSFGVTTGTTAGESWAAGRVAANGVTTTNVDRIYRTDKCHAVVNSAGTVKEECSLVSFDSDGFTLNWSTVDTAAEVYFIALAGGSFKAGTFATGTTATTVAETGLGFAPTAVLFQKESAAVGINDHWLAALGVYDGTSQVIIAGRDQSGIGTVNTERSFETTKLFGQLSGASGYDWYASASSLDSDGFTVSIDSAPGSSNLIMYVAMGGVQADLSFTTEAATDTTKAVTGVGFQPEIIMLMSHGSATSGSVSTSLNTAFGATDGTNSRSVAASSQDGVLTSNTNRRTSTTKALSLISAAASTTTGEAALSSFDSDGYTLSWTSTDGSLRHVAVLALRSAAGGVTEAALDINSSSLFSFLGQSTASSNLDINSNGALTFSSNSFASSDLKVDALATAQFDSNTIISVALDINSNSLAVFVGESSAAGSGAMYSTAAAIVSFEGESIVTNEFNMNASSLAEFVGEDANAVIVYPNEPQREAVAGGGYGWSNQRKKKNRKILEDDEAVLEIIKNALPELLSIYMKNNH